MTREADRAEYLRRNPSGEAKTVRVGFVRVPFWRCRPSKGFGPWLALPSFKDTTYD